MDVEKKEKRKEEKLSQAETRVAAVTKGSAFVCYSDALKAMKQGKGAYRYAQPSEDGQIITSCFTFRYHLDKHGSLIKDVPIACKLSEAELKRHVWLISDE